ncbi:hypothetical protein AAY473_000058 [Plecturocebus cupreus]
MESFRSSQQCSGKQHRILSADWQEEEDEEEKEKGANPLPGSRCTITGRKSTAVVERLLIKWRKTRKNIFVLSGSLETGFHYVGQAGLKLLTSSDLPALAPLNCWDYRYEPPCLAEIIILVYVSLSPRPECSDTIIVHCSLLGSSDPPVSALRVARTTGTFHHAWLVLFCFGLVWFSEIGYCSVAQANVKLLASNDTPASASQSTKLEASADPGMVDGLLLIV